MRAPAAAAAELGWCAQRHTGTAPRARLLAGLQCPLPLAFLAAEPPSASAAAFCLPAPPAAGDAAAASEASLPYDASCTPSAARPDGSSFPAQAASHLAAVGVEQATLGPPGTVSACVFSGKCWSNSVRYQYASLLRGVLSGYLQMSGQI